MKQAPKELKTRDRVRLHVGTDEVIARVILLEKEKLFPGESMLAQFVLESPTAAFYKDRFIIRTFSPLNTIGGGEVLDSAPARHQRFDAAALAGIRKFEGSLEDAVEQVFRKNGGRSLTPGRCVARAGKKPVARCGCRWEARRRGSIENDPVGQGRTIYPRRRMGEAI